MFNAVDRARTRAELARIVSRELSGRTGEEEDTHDVVMSVVDAIMADYDLITKGPLMRISPNYVAIRSNDV